MLAIYNWGAIDSVNRMFGEGDRPSPIQCAGPIFYEYSANSKGLELSAWNLEADGIKIYEAQVEVNRQARIAGPDEVMLLDVAGENTTKLGSAFLNNVGTRRVSFAPRLVSYRLAMQGARLQQALRDPNKQGARPSCFRGGCRMEDT